MKLNRICPKIYGGFCKTFSSEVKNSVKKNTFYLRSLKFWDQSSISLAFDAKPLEWAK